VKYFFTLFFIAILHLHSQLESSVPVDSGNVVVFEDRIDEEESHPWAQYSYNDGLNDLSIRFPSEPSSNESEYAISHSSVDTNAFPLVFHSLTYSSEPVTAEPTELFDDYLSHFKNDSFKILKASFEFLEDETHLDFFIVDMEHRLVREERIVVTEDNAYYLCSLYFLNTIGNHSAFVSSFEIN
jgi:hypothetical protein